MPSEADTCRKHVVPKLQAAARTEAIAKHLAAFLKKTDRFRKTIVFCVDQEHASEMREASALLRFCRGAFFRAIGFAYQELGLCVCMTLST